MAFAEEDDPGILLTFKNNLLCNISYCLNLLSEPLFRRF